MRTFIVLSLAAGLLGSGLARAADLPYEIREQEIKASAPSAVRVVVDELYLLRERCRRDPDCIAPRILPIVAGDRRESYVAVSVPIDPRFADRYR